MIRHHIRIIVALFWICATPPANASTAECPMISTDFNQSSVVSVDALGALCVAGAIDSELAAKVIPIISDRTSRIVINSQGGEVHSAIKIGAAIMQHEVEVIVRGVCASACANYVFLASPRHRIEQKSFIAFHGAPNDDLLSEIGCNKLSDQEGCDKDLLQIVLRDITQSNLFLNLIAARYNRNLSIAKYPPERYGSGRDWKTNFWVPNQQEIDIMLGHRLNVHWDKSES